MVSPKVKQAILVVLTEETEVGHNLAHECFIARGRRLPALGYHVVPRPEEARLDLLVLLLIAGGLSHAAEVARNVLFQWTRFITGHRGRC